MSDISITSNLETPKLKHDPIKFTIEKVECILLSGSHEERLAVIAFTDDLFNKMIQHRTGERP